MASQKIGFPVPCPTQASDTGCIGDGLVDQTGAVGKAEAMGDTEQEELSRWDAVAVLVSGPVGNISCGRKPIKQGKCVPFPLDKCPLDHTESDNDVREERCRDHG